MFQVVSIKFESGFQKKNLSSFNLVSVPWDFPICGWFCGISFDGWFKMTYSCFQPG